MEGVTIDTRGLSCPLPVLKVRKAMRSIEPAQPFRSCNRPLAEQDMRSYCAAAACRFVSVDRLDGGVIRMVIQKR